ncbi:response regulator transcription factor [Bifidobacterium platyrrhinorum]|uniref:Response regulator n=1 Tax=Bifidobacterium platyrrhinorum TaxID=2661628 RepID=A0A6L9SQ65_9BIFI|nr:response regulator transcription factor [Bifidobacterium platyrrhinorum]NEG54658.1 response regulator [Bifidobacterium platyrrhinorum]
MIHVMLVDDQRLARLGFQLMLDDVTGITVIAAAENGQSAIDTLNRLDVNHQALPDVILMDVRMPGMDGIEATRHITKHWPTIRILILTTYDEDDYAFGGLDAGASGFLLKDVTKRALVEAIRSIASGDAILTPRITRQVLERGLPHPTGDRRQQELRASFDALTPRQREICSLIAEGLSNEEIAGRLVIESNSVKRAVSRILTTLGLRDRTQIAVSWYKAGGL